MDKERDFSTLEIFSIAIKSEIEAARLYELMKSKSEKRTDKTPRYRGYTL